MRDDAIGLFWEDRSSYGNRERPRPPIPDTKWTTPRDLPRLDNARILGVDIETYDPNLEKQGPGYVRAGDNGEPFDGYICGVSLATDDASWYFPVRHPDSVNIDWDKLRSYLCHVLGRRRIPKVGANLLYDVGWLWSYGIDVVGPFYDVQCAEPLLDENALTYDLDSLGVKYEGHGKDSNLLYQWCADAFGGKINGDQRKNIHRTPAAIVGPYAEEDSRLPLRIIRKQIAQLKREGLYELFQLETSLIPLLLEMRIRGVRVDLKHADSVRQLLHDEKDKAQNELDELAGFHINVNAAASIAEAFDEAGLPYRHTKTGKPSFRKAFLAECPHALARKVLEVRKVSKAADTFVDSYIFGHAVGDRIHCSFHPLRTDSNGAVSGRFASSCPNLQNIPSREERLAKLIRGIFVPDIGCRWWRRFDYSQIEYRFLVHFASGLGAEDARDRYRRDPLTDFHAMTTKLIHEEAGILLDRSLTKNVNFGLVYGMAEETLRAYLGVSEEEALRIFVAYHTGAPFIKHTYERHMREARSGEVRTILGRKSRFIWWESAVAGVRGEYMRKDDALRAYGYARPAGTHKALNRVLQGSAADQMKQAMADAYYAGVFDDTGYPSVTVHDELGFSDPDTPTSRKGFAALTDIMQNCIKLSVPVIVESSRGLNWGACK